MITPERYRVAILGTRFGPPDIETKELAELDVEVVMGAAATPAELAANAAGAAAILAGSGPQFGRDVLAQLPRCRTIIRYGVGVDTIDIQAATELGIIVGNVPDYSTEEVSAHAMALMLACVRKLLKAHQSIINGQWQVSTLKPLNSTENLVLGIVGFGKIGQAFARKALPFGFEILVHDPFVNPETLHQHQVKAVALSELFRRSDVVSLHAPLTKKTHHLVDAEALALMKPGAIVVNTSRGGLIDEQALIEALNQGRIACAALDVLEQEPIPADHPLLQSDRVLLTPHMAWYTEQAAARMRRMAARAVLQVLRGEWPEHLVNPEVKDVLSARS